MNKFNDILHFTNETLVTDLRNRERERERERERGNDRNILIKSSSMIESIDNIVSITSSSGLISRVICWSARI